jgi:hypothetical protein
MNKFMIVTGLLLVATAAMADGPSCQLVRRINSKLAPRQVLEETIKHANIALNPHQENEVGYEVDYREELDTVWINIMRVKLTCGNDLVYYLESGKVVGRMQHRCASHADFVHGDMELLQVICHDMDERNCMSALAREVTVPAIQDMIAHKIKDAEVK